ncbi:hypothetical protein IWX46DRAFT_674004 [Phyllosticta citricarpa]|uniref:Transmembrane protein n=1 Tax=Phyllosticta citricarpa TaxID=55181 RepID=A0ABR1MH58_9PEZI
MRVVDMHQGEMVTIERWERERECEWEWEWEWGGRVRKHKSFSKASPSLRWSFDGSVDRRTQPPRRPRHEKTSCQFQFPTDWLAMFLARLAGCTTTSRLHVPLAPATPDVRGREGGRECCVCQTERNRRRLLKLRRAESDERVRAHRSVFVVVVVVVVVEFFSWGNTYMPTYSQVMANVAPGFQSSVVSHQVSQSVPCMHGNNGHHSFPADEEFTRQSKRSAVRQGPVLGLHASFPERFDSRRNIHRWAARVGGGSPPGLLESQSALPL